MVVKVTMEFIGEPTESERQGMVRAGELLSKHLTSVSVVKSTNFQKTLTAVFRMKNEADLGTRLLPHASSVPARHGT